MKRILVIGGAGFIGSHTVDYILKQGKEVVVFDNLSTGKLSHVDLFNGKVRFVQADVLNFSLLCKEMATCDAVLHLAAVPSVQNSIEDPVNSLKNNALGFVSVLQAIRRNFKPLRLVYASSAAVYGDTTELPCSDQKPLSADSLSPYALEKINNESYAQLFFRLFKIKSLGLRYFNVYGPRQDAKSPYSGVISKFIEQYQKKEPLTVFGDGEQSRDFIHVKDVALANWLALESDYCGVMNIAKGNANTLNHIIKCIENAGTYPAEIIHAKPRAGDIKHSFGDVNKAYERLKFTANIELEEGIKDFFKEGQT